MSILERLGADIPVIQAPMAGVQDRQLALAVAGVRGVGSLPCAMLAGDALRDELVGIAAVTERPININFFAHTPPIPDPAHAEIWLEALAPYFAEFGIDPQTIPAGPGRRPFSHEVADILEPIKPPVISFHFGLPPADLLGRVKQWGSLIMASATTVAEAQWLEERGVDIVIAQGAEAGGHRGMFLSRDVTTQMGTFALLPQVMQAVRVPVVAAGGIADAKTAAAALALGAAAVQVGTAYLLCPEAKTSPLHRAALKSDRTAHTVLTNLFSGGPARGMLNRVIRELGPMRDQVPPFPLAGPAITAIRRAAEAAGSDDFSPLWCGQNATGCQEIPAAELTRSLVAAL